MEQHRNVDDRAKRDRTLKFRLGHCGELLTEIVERPTYPADRLFARFFGNRRYLGSHDRGYIADTIYGILRNIIRLRFLLGERIRKGDPELEAALLLAAYIIEIDPSTPDEPLREALGFEEGEIGEVREIMRDAEARIESLPEPRRAGIRYSLPPWFAGRVIEQMGDDEGRKLLASLGEQAPITLRANTLVADRDRLAAALLDRNIPSVPGSHAPDALILTKRMNAHTIPEFKSGWFELQDEGSQLLSLILDPHPNWTIFDACAGAGGKTLHMAAIMRGRGSIVAHDINERRLMEMRPRLRRSGAQNVRVITHETYQEQRSRFRESFNAVMIDAPCSGAGVLRRNPGARLMLDEDMVERLNEQQAEILREYAALVRPGGLLLYATCSLLREENEDQVNDFLADNPGWDLVKPPVPEEMITPEGFFRCYPHQHGTDAFFAGLMRRSGQ